MRKKIISLLIGCVIVGTLTGCGTEKNTAVENVNIGKPGEAESVIASQESTPEGKQEATADDFEFEEQDGSMVLVSYSGEAASVTVPDNKDGKSVTAIGNRAFDHNEFIQEVILPDSITKIEEAAFRECSSLTDITLGNAVVTIGDEAFYKCSQLVNVALPDTLAQLGENSFGLTAITSITIPSALKEIPLLCFSLSMLETLVIPSTVESIGERAFAGCENLTEIEIQEGVINIGFAAYGDIAGLTKAKLPSSAVNIDESAFIHSSKQLTITAPAGSSAEQFAASWEIPFQAQ